jgi:phage shock protein B
MSRRVSAARPERERFMLHEAELVQILLLFAGFVIVFGLWVWLPLRCIQSILEWRKAHALTPEQEQVLYELRDTAKALNDRMTRLETLLHAQAARRARLVRETRGESGHELAPPY